MAKISAFAALAGASQIVLILLYAAFVVYDYSESQEELQSTLNRQYPMFADIHVMIFVGFGFLITFLSKYGWSAISTNFFLAALTIQWSVLVRAFFNQLWKGDFHKIEISLADVIMGDFSAGVILITFGVLLGNASPLQMLIIALIEVVVSVLNETLCSEVLYIVDGGGSMFVHMFGGFFGLAVSYTLAGYFENYAKEGKGPESSVYHSDLFALIGSIFLFILWPSFNAALFTGYQQYRVIINTVFSLLASCISAFVVSNIAHNGKFSMVHIQNATLAGGVAMGSSANLCVHVWGALLIGSLAGGLSTLGYSYLTDYLKRTIHLHDTAGVNNLHALPGLMGGLICVVVTATANSSNYGESLYFVYPALDPAGKNRSLQTQALFQLLGVGITLGISIVSGLATGVLLQLTTKGPTKLFDDSEFWIMETFDHVEIELSGRDANSESDEERAHVLEKEMLQRKGSSQRVLRPIQKRANSKIELQDSPNMA
eukprot:TRINITY_DN466_c0_g1_i1.p1 TRINITY_DN466_c0_g1~~TRINITY_DN466_c0_g1_i1.p1  ORF type:complete len:487 (+),score=131.67 TRINITY_DN466_c0_g1_i1:94-1554(+)